MMLVGYLLLAISAYSLFIIPLGMINAEYPKNRLGGMCVFIFWYYISNFAIALGQYSFNQNGG